MANLALNFICNMHRLSVIAVELRQ